MTSTRGQIVLIERSFCGQDADRHGGPGRGEGRGRGPVGCGSSLTRCGRHTGPRLPCPPHGEHASIGVRRYRARPFFASASPAPLPRRVDLSQPGRATAVRERPQTSSHPRPSAAHRRSTNQPRCSRSMIATVLPRSFAGELSARGMTPSASPALPSIGALLLFQVVPLKSQESLPHARWTG